MKLFHAAMNARMQNSVGAKFGGGGKRDRTADLLHAMQALSQLSYTPRGQREIIRGRQGHCKHAGSHLA